MTLQFIKAIILISLLSLCACKESPEAIINTRPEAEFGSLDYFFSHSSVILEVTHYEEGDFIRAKLKQVLFQEDGVQLPYKSGDKVPYVKEPIREKADHGKSSLVFLRGPDLERVGYIVIRNGNISISVDEVVEMAKKNKEKKPD